MRSPAKPVLWLDFDGVLIDSQVECLYVSYAAWCGLNQPVWSGLSIPRDLARYFLHYRGWVQPAGEYLAIYDSFATGIRLDSKKSWQTVKLRAAPRFKVFTERFHHLRTSFSQHASRQWLNLHRPYIKTAALRVLNQFFEMRILTTKDEGSVKALLSHFDLRPWFTRIIGKETIAGDKLKWLDRQQTSKAGMTYVDDHPDYVIRAARQGVHAYLADWGYRPPGYSFKGSHLSLQNWYRTLIRSVHETH